MTMRSPHWKNPRSGPRTFGSKYLNTEGKQVLSVAICDRCKFKFPYGELMPDPNFPGLRVCAADADWKDPYRLPARQTETITLRYPRPDESIATTTTSNELTTVEDADGILPFELTVGPGQDGLEGDKLRPSQPVTQDLYSF